MKNTKTVADMDNIIVISLFAIVMSLLWLGSRLAL